MVGWMGDGNSDKGRDGGAWLLVRVLVVGIGRAGAFLAIVHRGGEWSASR